MICRTSRGTWQRLRTGLLMIGKRAVRRGWAGRAGVPNAAQWSALVGGRLWGVGCEIGEYRVYAAVFGRIRG